MSVAMTENMEQRARQEQNVWQRRKHVPGMGPEKINAKDGKTNAGDQTELRCQKLTQAGHHTVSS
jgi:hypothetical protein